MTVAGAGGGQEGNRAVPTWLWGLCLRVAAAVLVGAAFHAAWVVLVIFASSRGASGFVRAVVWFAAPIVTATGLAAGFTLLGRRKVRHRTTFARAFLTALVGSAIGAALGSPIGPMFVGMGVLGGGASAIAVRCYADVVSRASSTDMSRN